MLAWWPTPTSVEEVLPAPNMELLLLRAFDLDHHGSGKALISLEDRVVTLKQLEGHEVMLHLLLRRFGAGENCRKLAIQAALDRCDAVVQGKLSGGDTHWAEDEGWKINKVWRHCLKSVKRKGQSDSLAVCRLKQTFRQFKMDVQLCSDSDNDKAILLISDEETSDGQESLPDPPEMINGFDLSDAEMAESQAVVYKDTALLQPSRPLALPAVPLTSLVDHKQHKSDRVAIRAENRNRNLKRKADNAPEETPKKKNKFAQDEPSAAKSSRPNPKSVRRLRRKTTPDPSDLSASALSSAPSAPDVFLQVYKSVQFPNAKTAFEVACILKPGLEVLSLPVGFRIVFKEERKTNRFYSLMLKGQQVTQCTVTMFGSKQFALHAAHVMTVLWVNGVQDKSEKKAFKKKLVEAQNSQIEDFDGF